MTVPTLPSSGSGWGGPRQGTPGKAYAQRTDLMAQRAPSQGVGIEAEPQRPPGFTSPDETPMLGDPSGDGRPVTDGLPVGPGAGPSALVQGPGVSPDRTLMTLEALYGASGSDHIRRLIQRYRATSGPER